MTEKRFTTDNGSNEDVCLVDNLTKKEYESNFNDIVDLMNKTWEQTRRFEKHNQYLEKENEQLKQRNSRQAKRLDNLYHLIEKEDWQTLKGIIQEFQECEEQLQREWSDYE